jgi:MULE transposase domain
MTVVVWKYVHKQQLILDGTFGLCTARLLVWIAMGVDENNHGVPVALFLFSAPTGVNATHAGYDTNILTKLLSKWKESFDIEDGVMFGPYVTITDTDTKERSALIKTWPTIKLLLCKYHL